jgi:hypothetical protein
MPFTRTSAAEPNELVAVSPLSALGPLDLVLSTCSLASHRSAFRRPLASWVSQEGHGRPSPMSVRVCFPMSEPGRAARYKHTVVGGQE